MFGFFHLEHKNQDLLITECTSTINTWRASQETHGETRPYTLEGHSYSLFFFPECQGNGLSSVLRESSWEMSDWDPALSANRRASLQVEGVCVCAVSAQCGSTHPQPPLLQWLQLQELGLSRPALSASTPLQDQPKVPL
jgi:hypothetical protein